MMSKGFQNGISQFEKKIRPSSTISVHCFGNLKKVCKKFFFHVGAIALAAYVEQLLPRGKAAVCCILPHGIVWTHLIDSRYDGIDRLIRDLEILASAKKKQLSCKISGKKATTEFYKCNACLHVACFITYHKNRSNM